MSDDLGAGQGELFSRFSGPHRRGTFKTRFKLKALPRIRFSFSCENLVFLIIVFIMSFVLSFSLGVEHGKTWSNGPSTQPHILAEKTQETIPVQVQVESTEKTEEVIKPIEVKKEPVAIEAPVKPVKKLESIRTYTIQLITFKGKASAEKELTELKKNGYQPFISNRRGFYEVCVGEYPNVKSAKNVLAKFRTYSPYHDAFLRDLN